MAYALTPMDFAIEQTIARLESIDRVDGSISAVTFSLDHIGTSIDCNSATLYFFRIDKAEHSSSRTVRIRLHDKAEGRSF